MDELDLLGKGAIREDIPDPRDYEWGKDVGMAAIPFDWDKGYDVEKEVSKKLGVDFKLPVKNQNGSSSCGGQAWAYYGQILDAINDGISEEKSAKFIYAQTHIGTGGSDGRTNCTLVINQGWGNEADTPSYVTNLPQGEEFYIKDDISVLAKQNALKDRGLVYANVLNREVENIATAVRDNYGCIIGITGTNNGTWRTKFPQVPLTFTNSWNHWVYCLGAEVIADKKYFKIINSWGDSVGDKGYQWISEDYIKTFILGYPVVWAIFTMVAKADVVIPPPYKFTKVLKYGMRNGDVKMLQMKLGGLITDGYFGRKTEAKVKEFQKIHGLIADGIVGAKTNAILNQT